MTFYREWRDTMTRSDHLPYLPTMFATCMWVFFPELKGDALLVDIFPKFKLLDVPSFTNDRRAVTYCHKPGCP